MKTLYCIFFVGLMLVCLTGAVWPDCKAYQASFGWRLMFVGCVLMALTALLKEIRP